MRIDPEGFCRSRQSYYVGMSVAPFTEDLGLPFNDGQGQNIAGIPEEYGINDVSWSLDSKTIAFTIRRAGSDWEAERPPAQLWVADMATGTARCVLERGINAIFEDYTWLDDDTIIASVIPDTHTTPPTKPAAPSPRIQENVDGKKSQTRTYQDLLKDGHDIALF